MVHDKIIEKVKSDFSGTDPKDILSLPAMFIRLVEDSEVRVPALLKREEFCYRFSAPSKNHVVIVPLPLISMLPRVWKRYLAVSECNARYTVSET